MWIIYKATNLVNNKLYIGQTKNKLRKRIRQHENIKRGSVFRSAINKYGKENFEWSVVGMCFTLEDANYLEEFFIKRLNTHVSGNGYNVKWGGNNHCGYKHTEEYKIKASEGSKGSDNPFYNKTHSPEARANITKSLIGHTRSRKSVICIETGKIYPSAKHATKHMSGKFMVSGINKACNNKQHEAYGYTWRWVRDYVEELNYANR